MYNLGFIYENGEEGIERDNEKAIPRKSNKIDVTGLNNQKLTKEVSSHNDYDKPGNMAN